MNKFKAYIKLMRVKQWIKNLFVFASLIFSNSFYKTELIVNCIWTFLAFSLVSSMVYIMNDIVDKEADKLHEKKKNRPIACGKVTIVEAIFLGLLLFVIAFILIWMTNKFLFLIMLLYFVNNIIYSFIGKKYEIIDVFQIALGFIFRIIAGSIAIGVSTSNWIILCTLFLTLYLGFGKRRGEILALSTKKAMHRKSLKNYSVELLDKYLNISLTCTIVFYALYTIIGINHEYFYVTNIFVIYALFRYNYLLESEEFGSNPSDLVLSDYQIWICGIMWVISCIIILVY